MECREVRRELTAASDGTVRADVERHLASCTACSRYAARLDAARSHFERRAEVEPSPAFAARVAERLRHERPDVLGRAALRLMPAAVALLLLAAWFSIGVPVDATPGVELTAEYDALASDEDDDDLMSWLLEENGNGR
jgi:anti-sigma factor RsiW